MASQLQQARESTTKNETSRSRGAQRKPAGGVAQARAWSAVLFRRLAVLEEGTSEYQSVRNALVEANTGLVGFAVKRFSDRTEQVEDIYQVGVVGLIKAVNRFDPDYGVEFVSFAMPTIVGEIKRFFRDTNWSVRVPRRLQELRIDLARATDQLAVELDHAPTTAELAGRAGVREEEVLESQMAASAYSASSLDAPVFHDQPDDDGTVWAERVGDTDPALESVENLIALKPLIAALPLRERTILSMRFSDDMTQSAIAARIGISQMHVSRLLAQTLGKLREHLLAPS
ncbi:SigB/SigF/SigG family RNA polymerase sigma factor [Streptomyces sp. PTM05]|uniref:SigB/SigF/SigG family RNA polymerase sigma factor n=1 Tax=Streptantibioticus parmotrematis TaxID=2873249 RepID=A0ABS7QX49_9ACTN|nr:SigB/SigF/SigG family RNA polymerase sigma factor [Streptantibioticus parmotrematis]MBY8887254.1 SigB/SigF/SigG family RNA polymerase sigma factor [Streptantibioticus parmotrematis]